MTTSRFDTPRGAAVTTKAAGSTRSDETSRYIVKVESVDLIPVGMVAEMTDGRWRSIGEMDIGIHDSMEEAVVEVAKQSRR